MAKQMSEREAWLFLEKAVRKAKPGGLWDNFLFGMPPHFVPIHAGLCTAINELPISSVIYKRMKDKIPPSEPFFPYVWNIKTISGRNARANFCRRQAESLKRRK